MLVAIKYLGNETRTGINQIEDWFLPKEAVLTSFVDAAGRKLHLHGAVSKVEEMLKVIKSKVVVEFDGHVFTNTQPVEVLPVTSNIANVVNPTVTPTKVVPPAKASANLT